MNKTLSDNSLRKPTTTYPFERVLKLCGGNKTQAAWLLGTTLHTLENLLKQEHDSANQGTSHTD